MKQRHAFTMIELLIVISIIAILAGMAMPMISMASRSAKRQSSLATMNKVETGLRLFKHEIGSFPYQSSYADTDAGEIPGNDLYRRLGASLSTAEITQLSTESDAAAAQYNFPIYKNSNGWPGQICSSNDDGGSTPPSTFYTKHAFRVTDVKPSVSSYGSTLWSYASATDTYSEANATKTTFLYAYATGNRFVDWRLPQAVMLNRMASERARLAIMAGNVEVTGCRILPTLTPNGAVFVDPPYSIKFPNPSSPLGNGNYASVTRTITPNNAGRDNSSDRLLASPSSTGWCSDYLSGEMEKSAILDDSIVDAWHKPLIYVCQVTEGPRKSNPGVILACPISVIDTTIYGLATKGRIPLTSKAPADPIYLPDPTVLTHSDRRTHAAVGFENQFELWSGGNNGQFTWMRDDPKNKDNIPLRPYDTGLIP